MPTWGELLTELHHTPRDPANNAPNVDGLRRKYLTRLYQLTGRPTFVYATRWTSPSAGPVDPSLVSVAVGDIQGFMEVMNGIQERNLDIVIHSPGGSLEGVEAIVKYLRQKFDHIRAIVPHAAMSAATMLSTACDEIILGKHSFLGPIDPQFPLQTPVGPRMIPAQAIIEQFNTIRDEITRDPGKLTSYVPMLQQYGPDLLIQCQNVSDLSEELVRSWLQKWMLAEDHERAAAIASWLASHSTHKTHGRFLNREELEGKGLKILKLEDDQGLQDAVLSVFHCYQITFSNSPAAKIIENHLGKMFVHFAQAQMQMPPFAIQLGFQPPGLPVPPAGPPQTLI